MNLLSFLKYLYLLVKAKFSLKILLIKLFDIFHPKIVTFSIHLILLLFFFLARSGRRVYKDMKIRKKRNNNLCICVLYVGNPLFGYGSIRINTNIAHIFLDDVLFVDINLVAVAVAQPSCIIFSRLQRFTIDEIGYLLTVFRRCVLLIELDSYR